MLLSYFIGQKKYPVGYDIRTVALFFGLAAAMFTVDLFCLKNLPVWLRLAIDTLQLLLYVYLIWKEIKRKR